MSELITGVRADRFVETLFTISRPDWYLVQETDRLGFNSGVALLDANGKHIALFDQIVYEELINI